jgi:hypothetical protein
MESKKWYLSKTLWANIIAIAVIVLANHGMGDVSVEVASAEGSILGIINLVLRLVTKQGLTS